MTYITPNSAVCTTNLKNSSHVVRINIKSVPQLDGVYQTAQKITVGHLCNHCPMVPKEIKEQLKLLKDQKSSDGGGKRYWAEGMRSYNVYETGTDGLALRD